MKITKSDLEAKAKRVNHFLKRISLEVHYRYNYTAIDYTDKNGNMIDTLETGLTKAEAYRILSAIETVLIKEG